MATPNLGGILRLRGRLVKNPTTLAGSFPFGGTPLGLTRNAIFRYGTKTTDVVAEEFGGKVIEKVFVTDMAVFAAVMRDYDVDMIKTIFPSVPIGSLVRHVKTDRGSLVSPRAFKLLFVPLAETAHPYILIYKALPALEETAELQLNAGVEIGVAAMFTAIPDDDTTPPGKLYEIGTKSEISLT